MWRIAIVASAVVLVGAACGSHQESPRTRGTTSGSPSAHIGARVPTAQASKSTWPSGVPTSAADHAPEPQWKPLEDPITHPTTSPQPMVTEPTVQRVIDLAAGPDTEEAGESFAIAFAQVQCDARLKRDQNAFLDAIVSSSMTSQLRAFLAQDYAIQAAMGARQCDADLPTLMRSQVVGDPNAPSRLVVEVAGYLAPVGGRSFPTGSQVTVVRDGEGWKVTDGYSIFSLPKAPWPPGAPTMKSLRHATGSPGWRRLGR